MNESIFETVSLFFSLIIALIIGFALGINLTYRADEESTKKFCDLQHSIIIEDTVYDCNRRTVKND